MAVSQSGAVAPGGSFARRERLSARGYPAEAVHRILGGNLLRVFGQVWR